MIAWKTDILWLNHRCECGIMMYCGTVQKSVGRRDGPSCSKQKSKGAFTLIELLVVIAIISALMGILLPALGKVKRQARSLVNTSNQREIVNAANLFAIDNDERYPESVATLGIDPTWNWAEPMMLTARQARCPCFHRSMSAYLRSYIYDAETMYCPNSPRKYKYFQAAWDAGDDWDNPEMPIGPDQVYGIYCFYWNYTGYLEERDYLFLGPRNSASGGRCSKLLVSDYLGYNHWRSPGAYSSCEKFAGASVNEGTQLSSDYWSGEVTDEPTVPEIKLRAGYTDGHVETYSSLDTLMMRLIIDPETGQPYDDNTGCVFLPRNALH